jgi:single-strand DNA-binding protein
MSVNKVILIGRLGKDPEYNAEVGKDGVCKFSLATSESWKDQAGEKVEKTCWHQIVAWGKRGEVMSKFLHKGKEVYLEGKIENRKYDDKDGVTKYTSEIIVDNFQFVGTKSDGGQEKPLATETNSVPDDGELPF